MDVRGNAPRATVVLVLRVILVAAGTRARFIVRLGVSDRCLGPADAPAVASVVAVGPQPAVADVVVDVDEVVMVNVVDVVIATETARCSLGRSGGIAENVFVARVVFIQSFELKA